MTRLDILLCAIWYGCVIVLASILLFGCGTKPLAQPDFFAGGPELCRDIIERFDDKQEDCGVDITEAIRAKHAAVCDGANIVLDRDTAQNQCRADIDVIDCKAIVYPQSCRGFIYFPGKL